MSKVRLLTGGRFFSRRRASYTSLHCILKSSVFTDCPRNLPEKCQQLHLSVVFLFPCLPRRLYLAIIDLLCIKGHRIGDDSSRSNHGDSLSLSLWPSIVSVGGEKLAALLLRFHYRWAGYNLLPVGDVHLFPIFTTNGLELEDAQINDLTLAHRRPLSYVS